MKKFLYGVIILLVIALIVIGVYLFNLFNAFQSGVNSSFEGTDREGSELREEDIDPSMDSFTVLILGVDENEARSEKNDMDTDDFRTDTMMLATFDKDADEVKLTSIPRDTSLNRITLTRSHMPTAKADRTIRWRLWNHCSMSLWTSTCV